MGHLISTFEPSELVSKEVIYRIPLNVGIFVKVFERGTKFCPILRQLSTQGFSPSSTISWRIGFPLTLSRIVLS